MKCVSMANIPFVVNKERVKRLKLLLISNSESLSPKEKNNIVQAFRFKHYSAIIKLYDKKNDKRAEFVKKLEGFFFVGETYFYLGPKDSKIFGVIILSRFKNLLNIGIQNAKKYNGQFDKIPDLSWVLFHTQCKRAYCPEEKEDELKAILASYEDLIADGCFSEDVLGAFISKKPVTSILVSRVEPKIVHQLIDELQEYFFLDYGYCDVDLWKYEIFVSRYKNLPRILSIYSKNNSGVYDRFSDVAGAFLLDFLENPSQEVATYCFAERLEIHNFIK